jgi:hypothetical protein
VDRSSARCQRVNSDSSANATAPSIQSFTA